MVATCRPTNGRGHRPSFRNRLEHLGLTGNPHTMRSEAVAVAGKDATAWRSLVAGAIVVATGAMPGFLSASLAPRIRTDFGFSASSLGLAIAVFYAACALLSTPAGHLVERI